jgi:hypothetical protein
MKPAFCRLPALCALPVFRDEIVGTQATRKIASPAFVLDGYRAVVVAVSYDPQSALVVDAHVPSAIISESTGGSRGEVGRCMWETGCGSRGYEGLLPALNDRFRTVICLTKRGLRLGHDTIRVVP